ncbi:SPFH domain-containing protein [Streptomyces sp. NPDC092046]|uniref:protein kinase domain-containing protein n=1 Tax=Streptomyces sp. NPDC092046 TaxID=3366009 RepID=UPI0038121888
MLFFITLVKTVQVVPETTVVIVERFGRYARTLSAGLNFVVPAVDSIRNRVDLREQALTIPPQQLITRDSRVVDIGVVITYQVTDARSATYEVASYIQAIEQLAVTSLRSIVSGMELERTLTSRGVITAALRGVLDEATARWGVSVHRVEFEAIEPPTRPAAEGQRHTDRNQRAASAAGGGGAVRSAPQSAAQAGSAPGHRPLRQDDPRRIGRYQLTAVLGEGGMGTVYLGRSPGQRLVAVKVIRSEFAADPTFRERFTREIEAARRVGGFHTAPVVDAAPRGNPLWLATEYIPGPSLDDVLRQQGALPTRTLHTLAAGVAEALERIHACGIVHRDLKPSNIIISASGPRIIDFGIARSLDGTALTRTNYVIGTQGFLAPEQLTGAPITRASDLYAFGMVLCHAAGAMPLADGESLESALGLLPSSFVGIVTRCLDHDPARRPTPTEVLAHLSPHTSPPDAWLPPSVRTMVDLYNTGHSQAP